MALPLHHCFIRSSPMLHCNICFSIQYWNTYITYAASLILFPPLLWIVFCLMFLLCYAPTLILLLCFQLLKLRLPMQNQRSCTLSAFCDCSYHLHCIPLLLGPTHHQTWPHIWQGAKKKSQLDTCQCHPSLNKLPILSHQSLHCISPPANEGLYYGV